VLADRAAMGGGLHRSSRPHQEAHTLIETVSMQTRQQWDRGDGDQRQAGKFVDSLVHKHVLLHVGFMDARRVKL
jgi:hypothetical protein